jgi:hypothetical protein
MAANNGLQALLDVAAKFVTDHDGQWNHEEWEQFLDDVSGMGFQCNDETKRNFGNILEACKNLYPVAAALAPAETKKAAAKSRAKAKAK